MVKHAKWWQAGWPTWALPGGIRARLFLLIALVLLPMLLLLAWVHFERYQTRSVQGLQTELEVAQGVATTFAAYLDDVRRLNFGIGQAIVNFGVRTDDSILRLLVRAGGEYHSLRTLNWVGADGIIRVSTDTGLVDRDLSSRPYFQRVLAGEPWAVGDMTPTETGDNAPSVGIATAIRQDDGQLLGLMVAVIEPTRLGELTLTQQRPAGGAYSIFDRQGNVVYTSHGVTANWDDRVRWRASDPLLTAVLATGEAQVGVTGLAVPGGEWMAARVPIERTGWVAGASRPRAIALAPVHEALKHDAFIAALIATLAFLGAYLLARTIAAPLLVLEGEARAIGAGAGIEPEDDPDAPTEVRAVRDTVAAMADHLIRRAEALEAQQAELQSAKFDAEEANRAKDSFLVNMSHELRTPMTVIMTSLELLLEAKPADTQQQFIEMADSAAHRLLGIIDDLLDITHIESGDLQIEARPFLLRDCVRRSVEAFLPGAREKGLRLGWEVAPSVPDRVSGDPERIGQVLEKLVGNAVKFSDSGEISVTVTRAGEGMAFTVRDTGIGIPPVKLDQLFERFTQADPSMTRRYGGTGLGLAICRELVELMGGTIRAESEEGRGSTFAFTLPLPQVATAAPPLPSPQREGEPLRVMLAEDEPTVRQLVQAMLARRGWEVAVAASGRQAVARWEEGGIDVVLMDLQMPDLDGLTATRIIRDREGDGDHIPILALTAHVRPEDREECLAAGMNGFLTKPIRMDELFATIENCLGRAGKAGRVRH